MGLRHSFWLPDVLIVIHFQKLTISNGTSEAEEAMNYLKTGLLSRGRRRAGVQPCRCDAQEIDEDIVDDDGRSRGKYHSTCNPVERCVERVVQLGA